MKTLLRVSFPVFVVLILSPLAVAEEGSSKVLASQVEALETSCVAVSEVEGADTVLLASPTVFAAVNQAEPGNNLNCFCTCQDCHNLYNACVTSQPPAICATIRDSCLVSLECP
ncbi:MAG: hypothetical protein K0U98_21330 [Deltaproteobacteria bacterium]|nr:hypothetical protein [Deltaproteobacteria bacterium]